MFDPSIREYTSVEILAWENNALAISRAVALLKGHLQAIPHLSVWRDVHARCKPEVHLDLIQWIEERFPPKQADDRLPKVHSPAHNLAVWMLYQAADLKCPDDPPRRYWSA